MGCSKQKNTRGNTPLLHASDWISSLLQEEYKKDYVKVTEIGSEESDYTECLASEMPHSSAHSDGLKSTRMYKG